MSGKTLVALIAGAVVAAGAAVLFVFGGTEPYKVTVPLDNAAGLETGSAVRIGGVIGGRVDLRLGKDDQVLADFVLEESAGKVTEDAQVMIVAANFLGEKRVELVPGEGGKELESGAMLPADRVTTPVDLDQVLNVFDADTRTRAKILLNEAGAAVVGRKLDISTLLKEFPIGLRDASALLNDLATDNSTMRSLVERSDRFVAEAAAEREQLGRMIDVVGGTAATVSARRAELAETLARAPETLRTLRAFSEDLLQTTQTLAPAAREITATAPSLRDVLSRVGGVTDAARPTLATATDVAPDLSRLAEGATPVLREANPTVRSLAALARAAPPVTDAINGSFDNVVAILENWSRAIQFRDGMSHVFRGEASFSPDVVVGLVDRLTGDDLPARKRGNGPETAAPAPAPAPALPTAPEVLKPLDDLTEKPPMLSDTIEDLLDQIDKAPDKPKKGLEDGLGEALPQAPINDALLDFLLG